MKVSFINVIRIFRYVLSEVVALDICKLKTLTQWPEPYPNAPQFRGPGCLKYGDVLGSCQGEDGDPGEETWNGDGDVRTRPLVRSIGGSCDHAD